MGPLHDDVLMYWAFTVVSVCGHYNGYTHGKGNRHMKDHHIWL